MKLHNNFIFVMACLVANATNALPSLSSYLSANSINVLKNSALVAAGSTAAIVVPALATTTKTSANPAGTVFTNSLKQNGSAILGTIVGFASAHAFDLRGYSTVACAVAGAFGFDSLATKFTSLHEKRNKRGWAGTILIPSAIVATGIGALLAAEKAGLAKVNFEWTV